MATQRTILITGASTGIGRATALDLDAAGWRVFAGVRNKAAGEALVERATKNLIPIELDVTNAAHIDKAAASLESECGGRLDAVLNNAGFTIGGPIECLETEDWRRQFEVNLFGQMAVTRAVLPMIRKARGRILFTSSVGGRFSQPYVAPYCASKFALEAAADALRIELSPWRIPVVLIEPGAIATPIWEKGAAQFVSGAVDAARQLYARVYELAPEIAARENARGIPAERVAEAVRRALTANAPRHRYVVGTDAHVMLWLQRLLPSRARDSVIIWQGKLPRTPEESMGRQGAGTEPRSAEKELSAAGAKEA